MLINNLSLSISLASVVEVCIKDRLNIVVNFIALSIIGVGVVSTALHWLWDDRLVEVRLPKKLSESGSEGCFRVISSQEIFNVNQNLPLFTEGHKVSADSFVELSRLSCSSDDQFDYHYLGEEDDGVDESDWLSDPLSTTEQFLRGDSERK